MILKNFSIVLFCLFAILQAEKVFCFQSKANPAQLRKLFTAAIKKDFEIVKDYINTRPVARGGETYWLVHVKPKRTGHYELKYTYKYTTKQSHPQEGENELIIRVGGKNCSRYNNNNSGLSNVCLGDTVIVPIELDQRTGHQFSLKSDYRDAESIGKDENNWTPPITETLPLINQLDKHLKYLGTQRSVMPHRNYGAETITFTAYFQAIETGRFNFTVTTLINDEKVADTSKMNPLDALPVIIVKPGTPITALTYFENTINYSDNKRFSGHSGHNFLTKLLIIQPGDIFSVQYSSYVERKDFKGNLVFPAKKPDKESRKLVMYKLPFAVNKDWSYNEWLTDYLPKGN